MNNFRIIPARFSTMPLLTQLRENPTLWNQHQIRTHPLSPHREADDILLHFEYDKSGKFRFYEACEKLPALYPAVDALLTALEPDLATRRAMLLGRIVITRLPMQACIYQHVDKKEHTDEWNRYHLCFTGSESTFYCGDETLEEAPGMCFWFDNSLKHWVFNRGDSRINLIVDVKK